ncbi:MAG: hypothetical protein NC337_02000 [Roseburia sp.]|nr:hypothetical protein [Roseburia sp.]
MRSSAVKLADASGSPSFLALRQPDLECSLSAELDFHGLCDGVCGGMAVYLTEKFFCRLYVVQEDGKRYLAADRLADDMYMPFFRTEVSAEALTFKLTTDGRSYYFYYTENAEETYVGSVSARFLSTQLAGKCFTGVLTGFFAEGTVNAVGEICVRRLDIAFPNPHF